MRKALLFNFLLEATIIASIAILLMLLVRKLFRKQLGNRVIAFAWLLVAIRLLCPLTLPNPAINEIRSPFANDEGIRPIAGQIQVRTKDFFNEMDRLRYRYDWSKDHPLAQGIRTLEDAAYDGAMAKWLMILYVAGAIAVAGWFLYRNIRFRHFLKAGRVEAISGKVEAEYQQLCQKRRIKPLPVYYTDPLPSACLVGVFRPYIALPLTSKPTETIHVLDHEICHFKGWDHLWGLVRLACCIVHWFNPLVWLAASLSMTDCELACDDRVTKGLGEEDRKAYANVLVLAAARKNAPGLPVLATGMTMTGKKLRERVRSILSNGRAIRWFTIGFATLSCVLLVFAFATAEYFPKARFTASANTAVQNTALPAITNEEDAVTYAKTLWASSYLQMENVDELIWSATKKMNGYLISGNDRSGVEQCRMVLAPNGTLVYLSNETLLFSGDDTSIIKGGATTGSWDDLADYLLAFMDYAMPGESNYVEAFGDGRILEAQDGSLYATLIGYFTRDDGYQYQVRMNGDAPQITYFCMQQPAHAYLWQRSMPDFISPEAHLVHGIPARYDASHSGNEGNAIEVPADALPVEEALQVALDNLCQQGETMNSLRRFEILYEYRENENFENGQPHWYFFFQTTHPGDFYTVMVSSPEGELLYLTGDEGNG